MSFGKTVSNVTKGADLAHPRLSVNWMLPAVVAVIALGAAAMIGLWLLNKAKAPVLSAIGQVPVVGAVATGVAPGSSNAGWIN